MLGYLDPGRFPEIHVSRFRVIPKGTTGKWHPIVDLSSPEGSSMNDSIDEENCSLSYVSTDDAVRIIRKRSWSHASQSDYKECV